MIAPVLTHSPPTSAAAPPLPSPPLPPVCRLAPPTHPRAKWRRESGSGVASDVAAEEEEEEEEEAHYR